MKPNPLLRKLGFSNNDRLDAPELRAIYPDPQAGVANYKMFMNDELKKFIDQEDVKLIGYRQTRDLMRNA